MTGPDGVRRREDGGGARVHRYVALGDSFTEGMCDPAPADPAPGPDGGHPWRGWADRLALALAERAHVRGSAFDYANLAVRGKLLRQVVEEQLPVALGLGADLVSLVAGGNDVLRPGVDVDAVGALLEDAVVRLRATGATVLLATPYDPRLSPLVRRTRGLAATATANVWSIGRRHDALVLDLWGLRALQDRRMWAPDRIHLVAQGHRRVAEAALELLDADVGGARGARGWAVPLAPEPARTRAQAWRDDAGWVTGHVLPWTARRLRGRSSGDGLPPKRPTPLPLPLPVPLPVPPLPVPPPPPAPPATGGAIEAEV